MVGSKIWKLSAAFAAVVATLATGSAAHAASLTMDVSYFTVTSPDPDYDHDYAPNGVYNWGTWTDLVTGSLGPDGLPVYNTNAPSNQPNYVDLNANGELTWWSPSSNPNVTATGTGTVTLPFANYSFFPTNGTDSNGGDGSGFQAAVFTGTLVVPEAESVTFTFGADDDAFLYLDGNTISQEEGIHGVTAAPVTTETLAPGSYSLELFYTDRHQTGAGLYFSVDTSNVSVAPPSTVPEPAPVVLMIAGLGLVGAAARRRSKR